MFLGILTAFPQEKGIRQRWSSGWPFLGLESSVLLEDAHVSGERCVWSKSRRTEWRKHGGDLKK